MFRMILFIAIGGGGILFPAGGVIVGQENTWQVGFAESVITPKPGTAMMAGFGRERYSKGTLDPLRAQALAFRDSDGETAILFAADVLGFGKVSVDALRRRIELAHGLPAERICFAASHTHWGPAINYRTNFAIGGPNVWYIQWLEATLLKLADGAIASLSPATIHYGSGTYRIGMNRRKPLEDGTIVMRPNPDGAYDEHTPIVLIDRRGDPQRIVLVGHACHPTSMGPIERWSADYPGAMRSVLEKEFDNCRAMFVMGCGGDAKVLANTEAAEEYHFANASDQSRAAGRQLANYVIEFVRNGELVPISSKLSASRSVGALSLQEPISQAEIEKIAYEGNPRQYRTWWARQSLAYPDNRREQEYEVQAWRLGELTMVALEGEVCSEWGPKVRGMVDSPHAMVVGYANNVPGYIPTAKIIREGGYEGYTSHMAYFLPAPFAPVVEEQITVLVQKALAFSGEAFQGHAK